MDSDEMISVVRFPVEELDKRDVCLLVCHADIVIGIDKNTGEKEVFFGDDALEEGRKKGTLRGLGVIEFTLDLTTDQCLWLAINVFRLKGSCCHLDSDEVFRKCLGEQQVKVRGSGADPDFRMPVRELNKDMVGIRSKDTGEVVFTELSPVPLGEIRHPPFPDELRAKIAQIRDTLKDVYPRTLQEWEDTFRRTTRPEGEIATFLHGCKCYLHFTSGRQLNLFQRRDILGVIFTTIVQGSAIVGETGNVPTLPRKRMREIAAFVEGTWLPDTV
jgi:hypothetical protein